MSAPASHDPVAVTTKDGTSWVRRAVTQDGRGLYVVDGSCQCPEFLMATLAELAEHGIQGQAYALPMPVPVASLREPEGEFHGTPHHTYRVGHDLPETGGLSAAEPAAVCRCDEPDADPYECEADDCTAEFSELNPFGGGPVHGHDAKVSRVCGCGWRTSVWHVNDGSAEAELHGHVVRVHGGTYPERAGVA